MKHCSINNCSNKLYAKLLCNLHYQHMRKEAGVPAASRLHNIWSGMKQRCEYPHKYNYAKYGGRGIAVCNEWSRDFMAFYNWALANGYEKGLTIDRINNDGNYEPSNCRWITIAEQQLNRSSNVRIEFRGKEMTLKEWSDELGWTPRTLIMRRFHGWTVERMLTVPPRQRLI